MCNLASVALPRFVREKEPSGREGKKLVGSLDAEGRCGPEWHGRRACLRRLGWLEGVMRGFVPAGICLPPSACSVAPLPSTHSIVPWPLTRPPPAGTSTLTSWRR